MHYMIVVSLEMSDDPQITKIMQKFNTRPRENSISQHQENAFMKRFHKFALAS